MVNVYIWENNIFNHGDAYGHASIQIITSSKTQYISWRPADGNSKSAEAIGRGVSADMYLAYHQEIRPAETNIKLSRLDETAMLSYWNSWQTPDKRYQLFKQNCSHVVAELLTVGWISAISYIDGIPNTNDVKKEMENARNEISRFVSKGTRWYGRQYDYKTNGGADAAAIIAMLGGGLASAIMAYLSLVHKKKAGLIASYLMLLGTTAIGFSKDITWEPKTVSALARYIKDKTNDPVED